MLIVLFYQFFLHHDQHHFLDDQHQCKSIVISAPSGAGKTSIVNFILGKIDSIEFSVSACNRQQRPAEVNGKNYHFLSTPDFKEKIDKGLFLEWEEVYPNQFYGTLFSSVTTILVPTVIVYKKGVEVDRKVGGVPESHMKEFLDKNI